MVNIRFSTSNLFVIMNMNYFKKFDKVIFSVWRSFNYVDYQKYSDIITKKEPEVIPKNISAKKQLEAYQTKYDFNITNEITDAQSSKTSSDVVTKKTEIMESLPKQINQEDLKEIQKLVNDTSNTVYGIKNEINALKTFEIQKKCKVLSSQLCSEVEIKIDDNTDNIIVLIGKIDGLTDKGEVVEIKNRVNKHFNKIRDYEEPQIMTYLWMNKCATGYMVENLNTQSGCNINIMDIEYENQYVEQQVIPNLKRFYKFFIDFMDNEEWKLALLKGEEGKIYKIYKDKY
jgi:hypothetical protein